MKIRLMLILFVISLLLMSCNRNNTMPDNQRNENIAVEQSSYEDEVNLTNQEIASHLATIASEVPNVNDAAAVVAGPYAVVGINIDEATERQRVGTIKFSVNEALQHDPYGKTAVVVADADMTQRLRDMGDKIQQGHPVQGVVDELSEIVSRYMPMFPVDEDRPIDEDENRQKMTDEERRRLDNIEKEQSNQ
ncbi:YhcN/YlaJ family sporulation lipoprotein [Pseudogracilibacillus auburnensis]|uniref:YhcN/YlaJ family sporulation lipoprotein n=1 Tax=Pseudogracilibacillus auburnensis TaxID=1494959 RepID=A0A2V3W564_9BACI|nr:YhcN/YlaJ family sporulation lipoprotein [Pseudogracilibacillus auburnensis]MBO1003553.1 YhcN/YlaJ family sporulation lipoprotein [Pseudogracilibacillus auburnensis]PXW89242.1 YhcN/YlaJ family sporulation lipoprotein [Pseudogracilibacillus auburnensis]